MIQTPYYLVDKNAFVENLRKIETLRSLSGAKVLLALKCFATWSVFDLLSQYMDGTTSSSLNEVRLGREKFGGETHAYSVAYADHEIAEVVTHADKIIFNSLSQFHRFQSQTGELPKGLRLNPGVSASAYLLADPARQHSRLGESDPAKVEAVVESLDGFMVHNNCENRSFERFDELLTQVEEKFGHLFHQINWVSLGGGIHFTESGYPIEKLAARLKSFAQRYNVQVYLEPGEAAVTNTTTLEVTVLDVLDNGKPLAIVDSSIEAHMLDLLTYQLTARVSPDNGPHTYMICGNSCLAGDIFGEFRFEEPLRPGSRISIQDAAGYTMVKKNWFNGVRMPAIVVRELDGSTRVIRQFTYADFASSLS
ncbi:carboxynorspermidine decarboxylase [Pusillimonas sp. CC-YST705]|uniref:Carboxynorspermidine/carboxyspermidine decarboxylase n=1 Tax=Mesopusillimonas faecipullorum TaxID=2755040 RepID=A0ABS8CDF6_9BURK|nr:carboxynorspermidine decarboxylase [Mesopusillimonas faecipullorum]MCB5364068.1 carboxynorspermidine decarboxylase [Mesopusillimonas faecipullorum]